MSDAHVIRFPIERVLEVPAPERGYCSRCGAEAAWPVSGAWPEACPAGCTPFSIQSFLPEPGVFRWGTAQGPPTIEEPA